MHYLSVSTCIGFHVCYYYPSPRPIEFSNSKRLDIVETAVEEFRHAHPLSTNPPGISAPSGIRHGGVTSRRVVTPIKSEHLISNPCNLGGMGLYTVSIL